ncbi:MAG: MarR family winged helix-turn-helix transcriptional regulator [Dethiobacteria bacterium]|jgi:DNA-binding MarR family transcriptional regulator
MSGIRDIWFYANNIIKSARRMVNEELRPLKLSSAEGNVLLHLLACDHILRQEDLVKELEISKPAVSRALFSLEKKGFVRREKDPFDKRVSRVFLTEKAAVIGPLVEQVYEKVFSLAAREVSAAELHSFIALFRRVSASFSRAGQQKKQKEAPNDCK